MNQPKQTAFSKLIGPLLILLVASIVVLTFDANADQLSSSKSRWRFVSDGPLPQTAVSEEERAEMERKRLAELKDDNPSYIFRFGSFSSREHAENHKAFLKTKGVDSTIVKRHKSDKIWYDANYPEIIHWRDAEETAKKFEVRGVTWLVIKVTNG